MQGMKLAELTNINIDEIKELEAKISREREKIIIIAYKDKQ